MNPDEVAFVLSRLAFYTISACLWIWATNKGINIWLQKKGDFEKCRAIKEEKGVFDTHRMSCALLVAGLVGLLRMSMEVSLSVLEVKHNIIELIDIVLISFQLISFLGVWAYLTYQSHLMEVRENARFLVLDTLFHNDLHTFRFNGKNLQGAMRDLLKAEMITPYGSSFSNTGIVYQLTQKGRNAYQEYLEVEAEKEALILPTSQVISTK